MQVKWHHVVASNEDSAPVLHHMYLLDERARCWSINTDKPAAR